MLLLSTLGCGQASAPEARPSAQQRSAERDALVAQLTDLATQAGSFVPRAAPAAVDPDMYALGKALFWDAELSGHHEEACASCHTKVLVIGMPGPYSIGSGPILTSRSHIGVGDWDLHEDRFFWDGRVEALPDGGIRNPLGEDLPEGVQDVAHAAFMFGGLHPSEMIGANNELAAIPGDDYAAIWDALMARLMKFDAYHTLFGAAFPGVAQEDFSYMHAALAMRDYATYTIRFDGSPWDRFTAGEEDVLSASALRGGVLFFGEAGCAECHGGPAFSNHELHNIGVPQFGPEPEPGLGAFDRGRERVTYDPEDAFRFTTPSLRHVAATQPYMHNGAFVHLEDAVRHHLDPVASLDSFGPANVPASYHPFFPTGARDAAALSLRYDEIKATLDPLVSTPRALSEGQMADLLAFLHALTDPDFNQTLRWVPTSSPSGKIGAL